MNTTQRQEPRFIFQDDERSIGKKLGLSLLHPIRIFSIAGLGIQQENFIRFMRPLFSTLHMDPYDAKRNKIVFLKKLFPADSKRLDQFLAAYYENRTDLDAISDLIKNLHDDARHEFDRIGMTARRKRAIARFILSDTTSGWHSKHVPAQTFVQAVAYDDPRSYVRTFTEASGELIEYVEKQKLIHAIAQMTRDVNGRAEVLEITMHCMFVFADALLEGDNSPEGIHQDGADYIVSALVIERAGILGGESIIYSADKKTEYVRRVLQVGEGIFQDDRNYFHYVTPIKEDPSIPPTYGNRSIIGFDINILNT